jgi:hypothetical protein
MDAFNTPSNANTNVQHCSIHEGGGDWLIQHTALMYNHHCCAGGVECRWLDIQRPHLLDLLVKMTTDQAARLGPQLESFASRFTQQGLQEGALQLVMRRLSAYCITGQKVSRGRTRLGAVDEPGGLGHPLEVLVAGGAVELHKFTPYTGKRCALLYSNSHRLGRVWAAHQCCTAALPLNILSASMG